MSERVLEQTFDMEAYIRKRALEITDLDERRFFKDTIEHLFMALYHWSEKEYQGLEERIFGELRSHQKEYAIYMGITNKPLFDATDPFLMPMDPSDMDEVTIDITSLQKALEEKGAFAVKQIFLETSYQRVKAFEKDKRKYQGIIKTDKGEYKGLFSVEKEKKYLHLIEQLYHIFNANYLPWVSVCTAYINKIFKVNLIQTEPIDPKEEIQSIHIDFEAYAPYIREDIMPLWNLSLVQEKTSIYPEPCIDKINYEHCIFAHRLDAASQYLVSNTEVEMTNIRRIGGDLIITCPIEYPKQWTLYKINHKKEPFKYPYPVLGNEAKESFASSLSDIYRRSIKTRAELARLIASYGYDAYLTFSHIELIPYEEEEDMTYDMDFFISDELRIGKPTSRLIIYFKAYKKDNYLNFDIMSFIITQVQKLFPEYHCCGQII